MLGNHKTAVLQFSGGKDSTALMYLARPWLDRITVIFADTGGTFPHVLRHIHETCDRLKANLVVVKPEVDVWEHTKRHGLPADIVPVDASAEMQQFLNPPPPEILQSYMNCCGWMLFRPMGHYIEQHNVDLVLRGSKAADHRVGVGPAFEENGITFKSPLWDWSDDDVYAYLKEQGASLPDHYLTINDSLDCWMCTAHLAHHGEEKMRYIREHYPDLWPTVAERVKRVQAIVSSELLRITPALDEACHDN